MSLVDDLRENAIDAAATNAPWDIVQNLSIAADRIEALEKALREIMVMRQGWPSAEIARKALDGAS